MVTTWAGNVHVNKNGSQAQCAGCSGGKKGGEMPKLWQYPLFIEAQPDGVAPLWCDLSLALFLQPMDWPSGELRP